MAKSISAYFTPRVIINLAIILGFLLFITWVLTFLGSEINRRTTVIGDQRQEINRRTTSLAKLAELREEARLAEPAYAELLALLPQKDDLVTLPRYLEEIAIAEELDFNFRFSGVESEPSGKGAGSSSFTINLVGEYQDIIDFIDQAETGRFVLAIDSTDIHIVKELFSATINGVVYYSG